MERLRIPPSKKDTTKQRLILFINAFVELGGELGSVKQAAIKAGLPAKSAHSTGSRLLKSADGQKLLAEARQRIQEKSDITVEKVLKEFAKIGFANIKNYFRLDADGQPHIELSSLSDDEWAAIEEITTETFWDGPKDDQREVRRVKLKMHSKIQGLEKIGKHLGMFDKKRGGDADDDGDEPQVVNYTLKIGNAQFNINQIDPTSSTKQIEGTKSITIPQS